MWKHCPWRQECCSFLYVSILLVRRHLHLALNDLLLSVNSVTTFAQLFPFFFFFFSFIPLTAYNSFCSAIVFLFLSLSDSLSECIVLFVSHIERPLLGHQSFAFSHGQTESERKKNQEEEEEKNLHLRVTLIMICFSFFSSFTRCQRTKIFISACLSPRSVFREALCLSAAQYRWKNTIHTKWCWIEFTRDTQYTRYERKNLQKMWIRGEDGNNEKVCS